jgi:hypothetical protein
VLKDFSKEITLVAYIGAEVPVNEPRIKVKIDINELQINFTPVTYEHLIFINRTLYLDASLAQMLQRDRKLIPNKKEGKVQCWINTESKWNTYHAILSNTHLYFYVNKTQRNYIGYYCIDSVVIIKHNKPNTHNLYQLSVSFK